jgi:hypothetical protein
VTRPTSMRAIAYAQSTKPAAEGATPRNTAEPMAEALACGRARSSEPLQGRMKIVPAHMA